MFVDFDQILQLPARYLQLLRRLVHGEGVGDHCATLTPCALIPARRRRSARRSTPPWICGAIASHAGGTSISTGPSSKPWRSATAAPRRFPTWSHGSPAANAAARSICGCTCRGWRSSGRRLDRVMSAARIRCGSPVSGDGNRCAHRTLRRIRSAHIPGSLQGRNRSARSPGAVRAAR